MVAAMQYAERRKNKWLLRMIMSAWDRITERFSDLEGKDELDEMTEVREDHWCPLQGILGDFFLLAHTPLDHMIMWSGKMCQQ